MTKMLTDSLAECERAPSPSETKRCVASIKDMVDFATSVLGPNVMAQTTESALGYNGEVKIGKVKGVNGGRVTKSVSGHQSLFPYMLYYCHSVPKVTQNKSASNQFKSNRRDPNPTLMYLMPTYVIL